MPVIKPTRKSRAPARLFRGLDLRDIFGYHPDACPSSTAFLACDQTGYRNLAHLVTKARVGALNFWEHPHETTTPNTHYVNHKRGHNLQKRCAVPLPERGRPNVTFADITEHSEGLFCLTGPATGELATLLATGRKVEAAYELDRWRDVFGHRPAIEVQLHHAGGHEAALATSLIEMAERNRVTWFATNDPRYLDTSGRLVHDLLTANRADLCVKPPPRGVCCCLTAKWCLKITARVARGLDVLLAFRRLQIEAEFSGARTASH